MERRDRKEVENIARKVFTEHLEAMEMLEERWVSADELCAQFAMITKRWLKDNKDVLPHTCIEVEDMSGKVTKTHDAYPVHRINRMIAEGKLEHVKVLRV